MQYVEAPNDVYGTSVKFNTNLFLAGGITNCPDWQVEFVEKFEANKLSSKSWLKRSMRCFVCRLIANKRLIKSSFRSI